MWRVTSLLLCFFNFENVADVLLSASLAFGVPLDLVQLFHLQVAHGANMMQHLQLGSCGEGAESAGVHPPVLHDALLRHTQVTKEHVEHLVPLVGGVQLQLVDAVGVVLTQVAAHVHRRCVGQKLQLPLVARPAFQNVIDVL